MRSRYRFEQLKKNNPEKRNTLTNKIIADLSELEKAVNSQVFNIGFKTSLDFFHFLIREKRYSKFLVGIQ